MLLRDLKSSQVNFDHKVVATNMEKLLMIILLSCCLSGAQSIQIAIETIKHSPFQTNFSDCLDNTVECSQLRTQYLSHLDENRTTLDDAIVQLASSSSSSQLDELERDKAKIGASDEKSAPLVGRALSSDRRATQDRELNDEDRKRALMDLQSSRSIYSSLRKILNHYGQQADVDHAMANRTDHIRGLRAEENMNKFSKQATLGGDVDGFKPIVKQVSLESSGFIKTAQPGNYEKPLTNSEPAGELLSTRSSSTLEAFTSGNVPNLAKPISGAYFDEPAQANYGTSAEIEPDKVSSHERSQPMVAKEPNSGDATDKTRFWLKNPSWTTKDRAGWYKAGAIRDMTDDKTLITLPSESTASGDFEPTGGGAPYMSNDYLPPLSSDGADRTVTISETHGGANGFRYERPSAIRIRSKQRTQSTSTGQSVPGRSGSYGTRYVYVSSANEQPVKTIPLRGGPKEYESSQSIQQFSTPTEDDGDSDSTANRTPEPAPVVYESDKPSSTSELDSSPRKVRLSPSDVHLRQIYPEPVQVVPSIGQASSKITQGYQHVLVQQQQPHNQPSPQRTVYSLATAPGGLKGYLSGHSVATHLGSIGATSDFESVLSPTPGGSLPSGSSPMHFQVQQSKSHPNRDLLNQPQTLQITAVPQLGYANGNMNVNGALIRLGPGAFAPTNGLYSTNAWNNLMDPFGRQMVMVNADRRELDWNFWIWPLLALVTLPIILSALFVPVFLKTVVVLIQVLQSLGLLLPITNALGNQFSGSIGSSAQAGPNQLEESTSQN